MSRQMENSVALLSASVRSERESAVANSSREAETRMSRTADFLCHNKMLKACLFDFGGTLDADGITWQDSFYRIYREHGVYPDREEFRKAFYAADDSLTESCALIGTGVQGTVERQVERVFHYLGLGASHAQMSNIAQSFLDSMRSHVERNKGVLAALSQAYRLGIISNFYGNLTTVCEDLGIRDFFDCVVDSTLVGAMKPDPRIFQTALDSLQVEAGQAVFVGDNLNRDMKGAKGVGMPHIWLVAESQTETGACCPQDPIIHSFLEVESLLTNGAKSVETFGGDGPAAGQGRL
jgi:HAD superfamily hydrolase (TIGR01549 family)